MEHNLFPLEFQLADGKLLMKPIDAVKETLVRQGFSQPVKNYEEKLIDVGTKVRYLSIWR